jgi:hypothetical protein
MAGEQVRVRVRAVASKQVLLNMSWQPGQLQLKWSLFGLVSWPGFSELRVPRRLR